MSQNIIQEKSFAFAVRTVKLTRYLSGELNEKVLSNQILRSGTSIGANIEEAIAGQSRRDFINKLQIARKETRETLYWLKLLAASGILDERQTTSIIADANELLTILTSIIISSTDNVKEQEVEYNSDSNNNRFEQSDCKIDPANMLEPYQLMPQDPLQPDSESPP